MAHASFKMVSAGGFSLAFLETVGIFLGCSLLISKIIFETQYTPYMDEIFHIRQAQKYCDGNFSEWDPKITTLPGLYLTSVGILKPVFTFFGNDAVEQCSVFWLRSINILFGIGNLYLLQALLQKIHKQDKSATESRILLTAVTLSIFPVMYFFTFLYYTDQGSTFFVLLTYLLHLQGNQVLAAMMGSLSIIFRQTNIVWLIFLAGLNVAEILRGYIQGKNVQEKSTQDDFVVRIINIIITLLKKFQREPNCILGLIFIVVKSSWNYICVGLGFLSFVIINHGIVVGDRTAHEACFHFPQIFYFCSTALVFGFVHLVSVETFFNFIRHIIKRPVIFLLVGIICTILIWKFTYAHPYLLADNRHYAFYVWSKIYRRHDLVKYVLIPVYFYAAYAIVSALDNKDTLWILVYIISVMLTSVPQKLLEFRYFILPYLILRLNMKIASNKKLVIEMFLYLCVNVLTLYLFIKKPFVWEHTPDEVQRFMW